MTFLRVVPCLLFRSVNGCFKISQNTDHGVRTFGTIDCEARAVHLSFGLEKSIADWLWHVGLHSRHHRREGLLEGLDGKLPLPVPSCRIEDASKKGMDP
jgi:hypothetical protein